MLLNPTRGSENCQSMALIYLPKHIRVTKISNGEY